MSWRNHPWERIFEREGRVFEAPLPIFAEATEVFRRHKIRRILDVGCGSGRHSVHLALAGFLVVGIDIALSGLQLTKQWAQEEGVVVGLSLVDVREGFPFKASSFDGVFSTQVIHHAVIGEVRRTIQEIHRVLMPGGLALVTVSARKDEGFPFEEIEPGTFVPQTGSEAGLPHHIFSEEELRRELEAFDLLEITERAEGKVLAAWAKKR